MAVEMTAPEQIDGMVSQDHGDVSDLESWDAEKVADYFERFGYGAYRDVFISNKLSGDRVILLQQEDVPELGIPIIGDRVGLMKVLTGLQSRMRLQLARKIIRQEEQAFDSCWIAERFYTCFGICPRDPDQYILKTAKLQVKEYELTRICGIFKCTCLGGEWHNDNIALDRIKDVDTVTETKGMCCCKVSKARILIAVAAGADAESEEARTVQKELFVEGDVVGDDRAEEDPNFESFADQILNAAEDYVMRLRGTM